MEAIKLKLLEQQAIIRDLILAGESKNIIDHQLDKLEILNKIFEAQYQMAYLEV